LNKNRFKLMRTSKMNLRMKNTKMKLKNFRKKMRNVESYKTNQKQTKIAREINTDFILIMQELSQTGCK
jgi:hypothetical protein